MSYQPSGDEVRHRRDRYLQISDLYVFVDKWEGYTQEQKDAWSTYRQLLRDLPQQQGFPGVVDWPIPPISLYLERPEGWPDDWL